MAVDGTNVYWTEFVVGGRVMSCPISGCAGQPKVWATGGRPADVAVDAKAIYWTDNQRGVVYKLAK
jgi:hypothetical protein